MTWCAQHYFDPSFGPVGFKGGTIKICPPLIMTKDQIADGLVALNEAFEEVMTN